MGMEKAGQPSFKRPSRIWSILEKMAIYGVLAPLAIIAIIVFYWMIRISFKETYLAFSTSLIDAFIPDYISFYNYNFLFTSKGGIFYRWIFNSVFVSLSVTLITLFNATLAGYIFARKKFPGNEPLFTLLLSTVMIPFPATMIPIYIMFSHFHLLNTYLGLILPGIANIIPIFWMRQYIKTLPQELEDAARIDGCSEFGIFWKIILPLCKPALAYLGIYTFWTQWNNLLWPLICATDTTMYTLTVGTASIPEEFFTDWGLMMAASTLNALPLLVVFLLFQKHFIKGLTIGALKG